VRNIEKFIDIHRVSESFNGPPGHSKKCINTEQENVTFFKFHSFTRNFSLIMGERRVIPGAGQIKKMISGLPVIP